MKKILVIEDDFAIRQSVEYALRRAHYEVKTLDSGAEALETIERFAPDLIVLDIMLPGKDGHEIIQELRSKDSSTAVIMISALGESSDKVKGLELGADDYLAKPFSLEELLARIEANLRRTSMQTTQETSFEAGDLILDCARRTLLVSEQSITLRSKEFDVLVELFKAHGNVCTRADLAQKVWGYEYLDSSRTLDVHIRNIRRAIETPSRYNYIKTVHGVGYQLDVRTKEDLV